MYAPVGGRGGERRADRRGGVGGTGWPARPQTPRPSTVPSGGVLQACFPGLLRGDLGLQLGKRPVHALSEYPSGPEEKLDHCCAPGDRKSGFKLICVFSLSAPAALECHRRLCEECVGVSLLVVCQCAVTARSMSRQGRLATVGFTDLAAF